MPTTESRFVPRPGLHAAHKGTAPFLEELGGRKRKSQLRAQSAGTGAHDNMERRGISWGLRVERLSGGGELSLEDHMEICPMF